jgi:hypothetical protein
MSIRSRTGPEIFSAYRRTTVGSIDTERPVWRPVRTGRDSQPGSAGTCREASVYLASPKRDHTRLQGRTKRIDDSSLKLWRLVEK